MFAANYVANGYAGGRAAATILEHDVADATEGQARTLVTVFLDQVGLSRRLSSNGLLAEDHDFDRFVMGFNQASPRTSIVDIGDMENGADMKIEGRHSSTRDTVLIQMTRLYRDDPVIHSILSSEIRPTWRCAIVIEPKRVC